MKNKNHMRLNRCRIFFDKNFHPFMVKLQKAGISQHNKGHIWQKHSQHHTQWGKAESISSKIRYKTRMPTFTTFIQHSIACPSQSNHIRKRKPQGDITSHSSEWLSSKRTQIINVGKDAEKRNTCTLLKKM